ncbi:response regulator transcription factor [Streptomyces sp. NBC_00094]|uniref:helix-turn-helix transcriptional regulator n=1 Tax=Streptomyces sp. NBC_00094 TaxID=2903620 RepID=UPI00225121DD|nr:response regulator transcription factor [Streptomyces sp. NBC_00094]MCX5395323.1 response regulator transcription factor [Streptomyces sp. NBC_00094]
MTAPSRIAVMLHAPDPIYRAGVVSLLRPRPEITLVDTAGPAVDTQVALIVTDTAEEATLRLLREIKHTSTAWSVLVVADIDETKLIDEAECGLAGLLRRADSTPDRLVQAITTAARGDGYLPDDLVNGVLEAFSRLPGPVEQRLTELSDREVDILRCLASGLDTAETAQKAGYAERAVKNVIHGLQTRLQLKNRAHLVAFAYEHGYL